MIQNIDPEEVQKGIINKESMFLLDVRTVEEFSRGRLTGAINLPIDELREKVELILPDKSAKVIVYCLSGSRSEVTVEEMMLMGYTQVYNMSEGILGWRIKQFPLEK